jgi:sulfite exporter TauE/SafE
VAFLAQRKKGGLFFYQAGRLLSYLSVGAFLGIFGSVVFEKILYLPIFSTLLSVGILFSLLVLLLNLLDFSWHSINIFGKLFSFISVRLFEWFSGVFSRFTRFPFVLGCLTSLLPCGWLGFFYVLSFSQKDPLLGALTLVVFWAGSLPVFILLSQFSQKFFAHIGVRSKRVAALILGIVIFSLSLRLFLHTV